MPPSIGLEPLLTTTKFSVNIVDLLVPIVAIIMGSVVIIYKLHLSYGQRQIKQLSSEEAEQFQQLHQGFEKLENRIEALETILIERQREQTPGGPGS